ncbi:hypothetical protein PVAP13_3NG182631 [Panicum virgatum]|uniref:Uncharacterized protein n=1 Tax=Panicum virgatum TaxID=38727 RepID=A0A8T0UB53_PANVG|nr:hypothetical protein PVAP13_3NG182631 [Panicum virgatum]
MALQAATSFLPSALSACKEGSVKDSAFLGVRLADGLKLETTALGRRSPRVELSAAAARSARLGFGIWELGARVWRQCEGGRGRWAGVGWGGGRA